VSWHAQDAEDCNEEFFQHRLVLDRSSLTCWRNRMGEQRLAALIQESLSVATKTHAIKPPELPRVIVDTTVQPRNMTFPTDPKLLNRAREKLVRLAQRHGVSLRQSYARVGKYALIQHQRYAHAKQFKRANRMLKTLRAYLGRVIRDVGRKIAGNGALEAAFAKLLALARRVREQATVRLWIPRRASTSAVLSARARSTDAMWSRWARVRKPNTPMAFNPINTPIIRTWMRRRRDGAEVQCSVSQAAATAFRPPALRP
jgi:hypothetical protein